MTEQEIENAVNEAFADTIEPIKKAMNVARLKWAKDMLMYGKATLVQPEEVPDWYWELYTEQLEKLNGTF